MIRDSNAPDVLELLNTTQLPTMRVESAAVLAGGRRRIRRNRIRLVAMAAAALLVIVPSSWLVARSIDRAAPVPAGKTHERSTGLFAQTNGVGNLDNGKVRLYDATSAGIDFTSHPTTYQITRSSSGLHVARIDGSQSINLHQTGGGAGGLFQSANGKRGIVAVEVPADVRWTALAGTDEGGTDQQVASQLRDGTAVVLIQTSKPLTHTASAVIWRRTGGALGASTGERPSVLTDEMDTFYYFSKLGAFGIDGRTGSTLVRGRTLSVGTGIDGSTSELDFVVAGLYPRGVADVRLSPEIPGAVVRVAHLPGTRWDLVTARYRATTKSPTPTVVSNYGTWDPSKSPPPATAPTS